MLIKQIKSDQEDARRAKAALTATLLTTLIGKAMMVAKNDQREAPTDDEVKEVIGRFVKGIRDTRAALEKAGTPADDPRLVTLEEERLVLVRYLPQQLTEAELTSIVTGILEADAKADMKSVMSALKGKYAGQYDGKLASTIVKKALGL